MNSDQQEPAGPAHPDQQSSDDYSASGRSSGDELIDELGRLGRKFIELLETAWNSDQRRQIESDVRSGLNSVADSLEEGLKDLSEKEQTKEFIGKAESVADNVGDKVRTSDAANELARGLASGLHVLADQLDRLASEMRASESGSAQQKKSAQGDQSQAQDIPISKDPNSGSDS